jgi:predicted kinase
MKTLENDIKMLYELKYKIIIDMTNLTKLNFLHKSPIEYSKRVIIFKISDGLLKERLIKRERETGKHVPDHVIKDMIREYKPLDASQFDSVEILDQDLLAGWSALPSCTAEKAAVQEATTFS